MGVCVCVALFMNDGWMDRNKEEGRDRCMKEVYGARGRVVAAVEL